MLFLRTVAKTYDDLALQAVPQNAKQPEVVPAVFYDTQTYTSAATTLLTFFQTGNSDVSLSNMPQGGTLPQPQYFEIHRLFLEFLGRPTVSAAAGTIPQAGLVDDVNQLLVSGRGYSIFSLSSKSFPAIPLSFLGAPGGVQDGVMGVLSGTTAGSASQVKEYGHNANNGGFPVNGQWLIPPSQSFQAVLAWPAALTLTGNVSIRLSMMGNLYRRVT
jgi:hypothetical protein